MSRDRVPPGEEFADYLAARWPSLVRTVVLLGHPLPVAREVAFEALVAVEPDFRRLHREEDVDVAVHRELLDARDRVLRHADRAPDHARPLPVAGDEDARERLAQVRGALSRMTPDEVEVVVLRQVAELGDEQVADVLGRAPGPAPLLADPDVRQALDAIEVEPLTAPEVEAEARARRRRVVRRSLAGLVAVAVVAALVTGVSSWRGRDEQPPGEVRAATNPLPLAWYADGLLHLADVTVTVRPVVDLAEVPGGVVLTDESGEVAHVEDDGTLTTLGRTVPGEGLVAEPDNGWVAWADPGDGAPELVVHDTRVGEEVGRRSLAVPGAAPGQPVAGSGPVAVVGERVFYAARGQDYVWEPLPGLAFSVAGSLADTASGARLTRAPGGYVVQGAPYQTGNAVEGTDGELTEDGRYVVVRDAQGELVVHDSRTGREEPRLYSPSDRAVAWSYREGVFWFAVVHKLQDKQYQDMLQMPSEGNYRIFECLPGRADACVEQAEVPEDVPEPPVLAR